MYRLLLRCWIVPLFMTVATLAQNSRAESAPVQPAHDEAGEEEQAVLFTIHPGTTLFEKYGHTLLCLLPEGTLPQGTLSPEPNNRDVWNSSCFDFGVFSEGSVNEIVTGSLRGRPMFRVQELPYGHAVEQYRLLDRTIEHQALPLSRAKVSELRGALEDIRLRDEGYAYHPFYNNCSTQVRDVLDRISGGKLKVSSKHSSDQSPSRKTFRAIAEEGFSGQALTLVGVELLVGSSASHKASAWQQGAFPIGLRDLVKDAWDVDAVITYQQTWRPLPTSVHAGRAILVLFGLVLAGWIYWSSRRVQKPRWFGVLPLATSGGIIALLGLLAIGTRLYSHYPEFSSNFAPLILFPGDAALALMSARVRKKYVLARLATIALLLFLSLISVVNQPIASLALFASLPLLASISPTNGVRPITNAPDSPKT